MESGDLLTKLFLERFMSYNERTEIELAPLTVIVGPNSSGKSSILRALRLLRDFPQLSWDLESSPTYGRADTGFVVGAELQAVWSHVEPGPLLGWEGGEEYYGEDRRIFDSEVLRVEYEFESSHSSVLRILGDEAERGTYVASNTYGDKWENDPWWHVTSDTFIAEDLNEGFPLGTVPLFMYPEIRSEVGGGRGLPRAPVELFSKLTSWEEVGPIRNPPSQLVPSGQEEGRWNKFHISNTNSWFTRLGIPYELVINELSFAGEQHVRRYLIDKRTGSQVWLKDVGTGISQVIPVVMACIRRNPRQEYARIQRETLLTIEQPELHLHPRLQSEMAELLADTVWTRSEGFFEDEPDIESTGVQVLVETHSEHLVLRLQSLVRRKLIPHDEISLLYVWIENGSSKVKRIHLNSRGEFLDEWPEGFFDERLQEILGWSDDI
jgi:hypothetical protein